MKNKITDFIKANKGNVLTVVFSCGLLFEVSFNLLEIPEVSFSYTAQVNNTISNSCSSDVALADGSSKSSHQILYEGCFVSDKQNYVAYRTLPNITHLVKDLSPNI